MSCPSGTSARGPLSGYVFNHSVVQTSTFALPGQVSYTPAHPLWSVSAHLCSALLCSGLSSAVSVSCPSGTSARGPLSDEFIQPFHCPNLESCSPRAGLTLSCAPPLERLCSPLLSSALLKPQLCCLSELPLWCLSERTTFWRIFSTIPLCKPRILLTQGASQHTPAHPLWSVSAHLCSALLCSRLSSAV